MRKGRGVREGEEREGCEGGVREVMVCAGKEGAYVRQSSVFLGRGV